MDGIKIHKEILEFKEAYECGAIETPQYRITCKEHKALVEYLKPISDPNFKPSMIAEYYGIRIEVVMVVDPYI